MWEIASIVFSVRGVHLFFSKQFCDCFEKLVYGYSFPRADVDNFFVSLHACMINMIDKLGVKDNVRFLGNFLPQDLAKLYKASRVFLDPSIYGPINTANLEALACGTPVICSKSIGTGEIISACDAGFVVDRIPKSWAKLVVKLINDEKLAIEMARRGSRMILDNFSWDKISEKYLEIYRKVTREAS